MNPAILAPVFLVVAGFAALAAGWVRRGRLLRAPLDVPNERSSHLAPTPRGGGLVIGGFSLLALLALSTTGALAPDIGFPVFAGGLAVMASSWRDDVARVAVPVRLLIQTAAAVMVVAALEGFPSLDLGAARLPLGAAGSVLAVVGLAWFTNLYNFMDGIDGLAGGQAVIGGVFLALVLWRHDLPALALVAAVMAASALGFLHWNWPPARLFMGDVGSCTLGFLFGAIALIAEREAGLPLVALLLPFGVFIMDATFTLGRRLVRGERITRPHRTHVYQRLVAAGWSHRRVTLLALGAALVLSAGAMAALAVPAALVPGLALAAAVLAAAGWLALRAAERSA